jgi:hypothetical protein
MAVHPVKEVPAVTFVAGVLSPDPSRVWGCLEPTPLQVLPDAGVAAEYGIRYAGKGRLVASLGGREIFEWNAETESWVPVAADRANESAVQRNLPFEPRADRNPMVGWEPLR